MNLEEVMQHHERAIAFRHETSAEELPFSLAIMALEKAATPDEVILAFKDAAAGFARAPNARNARKVEATMVALRHHRQQAAAVAAAAR